MPAAGPSHAKGRAGAHQVGAGVVDRRARQQQQREVEAELPQQDGRRRGQPERSADGEGGEDVTRGRISREEHPHHQGEAGGPDGGQSCRVQPDDRRHGEGERGEGGKNEHRVLTARPAGGHRLTGSDHGGDPEHRGQPLPPRDRGGDQHEDPQQPEAAMGTLGAELHGQLAGDRGDRLHRRLALGGRPPGGG
jgi:hypothetical protein